MKTSPPQSEPADFNAYRDSYRDAVQEAIAFSGASPEFFTRVKARRLLELAEAQLGDPTGLDVLDVGCGVGETDRFLEGSFGSLTGVDVAGELVERAAEANPWASYRSYAQGESIPFDRDAFDLTFAICVLHHVDPPDREAFAAELTRVTRPGGLVVVFEHNPLNPLTRRTVRNCAFDEGVVLLSRGTTRRLLEGQALSTVEAPFIVFFTREGSLRQRVERSLAWLPAGAQYCVAARKPKETDTPDGARSG